MKLFVAIAILRHTAPCWCKYTGMNDTLTNMSSEFNQDDDYDNEDFASMSEQLMSWDMNVIEDSYIKELCDLGLIEVFGEGDNRWIRRTPLGELTLRYYLDASRGKHPSFRWDNFYLELSNQLVQPTKECKKFCSMDCSNCKKECKRKPPFDWMNKATYCNKTCNQNCKTTKESVEKQKEEFLNKIKEFTKNKNLDGFNIIDNILNIADGGIEGFFVFGNRSDGPDFDDEE